MHLKQAINLDSCPVPSTHIHNGSKGLSGKNKPPTQYIQLNDKLHESSTKKNKC